MEEARLELNIYYKTYNINVIYTQTLKVIVPLIQLVDNIIEFPK